MTLTNTGTATLNITSIAITGSASADFGETNNCGASLAPSASCTINITFTPSKANTRAANLQMTDSGSPRHPNGEPEWYRPTAVGELFTRRLVFW